MSKTVPNKKELNFKITDLFALRNTCSKIQKWKP